MSSFTDDMTILKVMTILSATVENRAQSVTSEWGYLSDVLLLKPSWHMTQLHSEAYAVTG